MIALSGSVTHTYAHIYESNHLHREEPKGPCTLHTKPQKNTIIFQMHYNFFSQLQRFFKGFIYGNKFSHRFFLEKSGQFCVKCVRALLSCLDILIFLKLNDLGYRGQQLSNLHNISLKLEELKYSTFFWTETKQNNVALTISSQTMYPKDFENNRIATY